MAWAKGTSQTNGTFNTTTGAAESVTLGPVAVGDLIAVALSIATDPSGNPTTAVVNDNLGNAYTAVTNVYDTTQDQRLILFRCIVTAPGTPTITPGFNPTPGTTTALAVTISAEPFTGSDASSTGSAASQVQVAPGTGTDAISSGAFSTTADGSLVYAATVDTTTGADPGAHGTGFTDGSVSSGATTIVTRTEYKTQALIGSAPGTFTAATGGDRFITAVMAVTPATPATQTTANGTELELRLNRPRPGRGPYSLGRYFRPIGDLSRTSMAFFASIVESLTGTDSQAGAAAFATTQAEAVSMAEATAALAAFQAAQAETVAATDSATAAAAFAAAEAETLTATDSSSSTAAFAAAEAESLAATDSASASAAFQAAEAESLAPADSVAYQGGAQSAGVGEAATITDSSSATAAFAAAEGETLAAADAAAATAAFTGAQLETLSATDSSTGTSSGGAAGAIAEAVTVVDAPAASVALHDGVAEAVTLTDSVGWLAFIAGNLRRWLVAARARVWGRADAVPRRVRVWTLRVKGGSMQLEKRSSESVKYDIDFSQLLGVGETIATILSLAADQSGLTFRGQAVNLAPITYSDGHVAPIGQVVQVTIAAGTIAAGQLSQRYTIRCKVQTSVNTAVEATVYLLVNDTPAG